MWGRQNKYWTHYRADIIATDSQDGTFLIGYLRHVAIHKLQTSALEVIDLQRYRIIKQPVKVKVALDQRISLPFVFVSGKN